MNADLKTTESRRDGGYCFMMIGLAIILLLTALNVAQPSEISGNDVIWTTNGPIRGQEVEGYVQYLGVPFAAPPVGDLRFRAPILPEKWSEVKNCTTTPNVCPQLNYATMAVDGDEDCLFLNVFVPNNCGDGLLPVVFYIHGGGFFYGSGTITENGPQQWMTPGYCVVVVTTNYRLGALGFLSTEDSNAPGNYGMRDQVMALRWAKDNIKNFGGNPRKITIMGQSAGSVSVGFHVLSPESRGLFNKAAMISGAPTNYWATQENALEHARQLAGYVGCESSDNSNMIQCLRSKTQEEIVTALKQFLAVLFYPFIWTVVVDGVFLPKPVCQLLDEYQPPNDMKLLIGHAESEGYALMQPILTAINQSGMSGTDYFANGFAEHLAIVSRVAPDDTTAVAAVNAHYNTLNSANNDPDVFARTLSAITGDSLINAGLIQFMNVISQKVRTYVYRYDYTAAICYKSLLFGPPCLYPSHADELFFLWDYFGLTLTEPNDIQMGIQLRKCYLNFVKDGRFCNGWPYSKHFPTYLELKLTPEVRSGVITNAEKFWTPYNHLCTPTCSHK